MPLLFLQQHHCIMWWEGPAHDCQRNMAFQCSRLGKYGMTLIAKVARRNGKASRWKACGWVPYSDGDASGEVRRPQIGFWLGPTPHRSPIRQG